MTGPQRPTSPTASRDLSPAPAVSLPREREEIPEQIRQVSPFLRAELAPATHTDASTTAADDIAAVLAAAAIPTAVRNDELAVLWDKFAFLAPIALATTALTGPWA